MTDVTLGKRRKAGMEKPAIAPVIQLDHTDEDATVIQLDHTEEPKIFTYEYDDEAGTVDFELTDGTPVTLRSPRATQFLTVSSWISTSDPEMRSNEMATIRTAAVCMTKMGKLTKVSMEQILKKLDETNDPDDIKRLAIAVSCFQSQLERFFQRDRVRGSGAGVSD